MTTIYASDPHSAGQPWVDKIEHFRHKYPDAEIVFGGDYVDGIGQIDPLTTLTYIQHLQATQDNVHVLVGNHDDLLIDFLLTCDTSWFNVGGKNTVKTLLGRLGTYRWDQTNLANVSLDTMTLGEWYNLRNHHLIPYYHNRDGFFVHAFIDINQPSIPLALSHTTYANMIWNRHIARWTIDERYAVKWKANHTGVPLIVGHTPTSFFKNATIDHGQIQQYGADETSCPIIRSQVDGCAPIYACDGGAKSDEVNQTGNVIVFKDGEIIDFIN